MPEIGIAPLPVNDPDGTIWKGEFIENMWRSGISKISPDFRRFRDQMLKVDLEKRKDELDATPLADLLKAMVRN